MATTSGTTSGASTNHQDDTGAPAPVTDFLVWLERRREDTGLTWAEVSRRSRISENGLRKIRQGESTPKPATVTALARAFSEGGAADLGGLLADVHGDPMDLPPVGAHRGEGLAVTYLTVGVSGPRATRLDPETAGRLIQFLQAAGRAWLATADCPEKD